MVPPIARRARNPRGGIRNPYVDVLWRNTAFLMSGAADAEHRALGVTFDRGRHRRPLPPDRISTTAPELKSSGSKEQHVAKVCERVDD